MTVVAAVADGTHVWMASDTGNPVSGTWMGAARKIRRVQLPFNGGAALLACTGAGGLMTVACAYLDSPDARDDARLDRTYHHGDLGTWADVVAHHLTTAAATTHPPLTEPDRDGMAALSGAWLLGYRGRLWYLLHHHALPVPDGLATIGIGADLALGWMLGARSTDAGDGKLFPGLLVQDAVRAACTRIPYCHVTDTGPLVEHLP